MTDSLEAASISKLRQISECCSSEAPWAGSPLEDQGVRRKLLGTMRTPLALDLSRFPARPSTGTKDSIGLLSRTWQGLPMNRTAIRTSRACPSGAIHPKPVIDTTSIPRLSAADQSRLYFLPFSSRKKVRSSLCSGDSNPLDRRKAQQFQLVPRIHARWNGQLHRGSSKGPQLRL